MAPPLKQVLPAPGYLIVELGLPSSSLATLLAEAVNRDYDPVFREVGGKNDDEFREQSRVVQLSAAVAELKQALQSITVCLEPAWNPSVYFFMRSQPHGEEQEFHQDYPEHVIQNAKKKGPTCVPASMILALEPGTRLRVYDGCFATKDEACGRIIAIPVGFCAIFRGDLIHNGVSYSSINHRIHCYLSYRGLTWKPDVVNSVLPPHFECQYCGAKYAESDVVRQHRRFCSKNPDVENNLLAKRKSEDKIVDEVCNLCGKKYANARSYRSYVWRGCKKRKED